VLFTDIVDSTRIAGEMGDRRWRELVGRHNRAVRAELKRFGGREIDTAGDGFFATFDEPDSAIRCAVAVTESVRELGVEIRAGTHTGEAEVVGKKMRGIAVHIGARVMSLAPGGRVFATGTVKDLVAGAGISFEHCGMHELKGVEGEWPVHEVVAIEGIQRTPPLDLEEAQRRRERVQAPPLVRRRLGAFVALTSLIAAGAVVFVLLQGGDGTLSSVPANSVGVIQSETGEVTAALELGAPPQALAVSDGVVWVVSLDARTLTRLDPESKAVGPVVATQGGPTGIAVDVSGSIWVLNRFEGTVVRFDPDRVRIEDDVEVGVGANDMAAGEGGVWVTNEVERSLLRIDPESIGPRELILDGEALGGEPRGVAVGGGWVWVTVGRSLLKVDPIGGTVKDSSTLRFEGQSVTFGEGFVWVVHGADDAVSRVDPGTLQAIAIPVGDLPLDVAAGAGAAWVAIGDDESVSRIDPSSGEAQAIELGAWPEGVAVGGATVFVAVR
jgi:streptogramin lyase